MEVLRSLHGYPDSMYNCSGKTQQEWEATGEKWPVLGPILISVGAVYINAVQGLYILSVCAIYGLGLTKHSCYRIMVALILIDIMNIVNNSFTSGYIAMIGGVFCTNPFWMFLQGASCFFFWSSACFLYVLLGLNRAFCVLQITKFDWFFAKFYGAFWIVLMLLYASYCGLYHTPLPFHSKLFMGVFVPGIDEDLAKEIRLYHNPLLAFNNIFTSVFLFLCYGLISVTIYVQKEFVTSDVENKILLQAVLITVPTQVAACIYTFMQYSSTTSMLINIVGHVGWQTASGMAAVVYLTINNQVRRFLVEEFKRLPCLRRKYELSKVATSNVLFPNNANSA